MPLIQVGAPKGAMCKEKQNTFMKKLSDAVMKSEGATIGDKGAESLTWAYYNEIEKESCYLGGNIIDKQPIYITVTTPQDAISVESKKVLTQEVKLMVDDAIGEYDDRLNYWLIFLNADADDTWGAAGQLFTLSQIKSVMSIEE